ncbi:MAG: phage tail tip lysozyme, partial [bacterium]|nr:phage tail tip lysozyme [bacterium]
MLSLSVVENAYAQVSPEQRRLIQSGVLHFDIHDDSCKSSTAAAAAFSSSSAGGTIYVIGDSLTDGMSKSGELERKLTDSGNKWEPTKINAKVGEDIAWGVGQVKADREIVVKSKSILIGLGTNNLTSVVSGSNLISNGQAAVEASMLELVQEVKGINANIKIYWTNFHMEGTYNRNDVSKAKPVLNAALDSISKKEAVAIIPWGSSTEAEKLVPNNEVHPVGKYAEMADYVVAQLGNSGGQTPTSSSGAGCVCTSGSSNGGSDNQQNIFNFFIENGYTPEQSAGIVGNMIHESGVEPMREQGQPIDKLVSSRDVIEGTWSGGPAWGIV